MVEGIDRQALKKLHFAVCENILLSMIIDVCRFVSIKEELKQLIPVYSGRPPAPEEWEEGEGGIPPGCSCHITSAPLLGSRLYVNNMVVTRMVQFGSASCCCYDNTPMPFLRSISQQRAAVIGHCCF